MPLIENPLSTLLQQTLAFQAERHNVIASNIANSNTPGFKSFELVLRKSVERVGSVAPMQSDPRHLSQTQGMDATGARVERSRAPARLDGNNVSLDDEFMKLSENRIRYQALFEMMDKWSGLMPIAREIR